MNAAVFFLSCLMSLGTPLPAGPAGATGAEEAVPVKIRLTISAREELRTAIRDLVTAEFQSREPVQWVESDADWTIGIVTTQMEDANGATVAIGLSFVIEQHGIHMKLMQALAQACRYFLATGLLQDAPLEKDMKMLLHGVDVIPKPESLSVVSQHKMCVIPPNRLAQACRDIVLAFEADRVGTFQGASPTPGPAPAAAGSGQDK
jgi:hypothetical protein